MNDLLKEICDKKRAHVAECKKKIPLAALEDKIASLPTPRNFKHALEQKCAAGTFALIAEIKRASPSAGAIRSEMNVATLAKEYAEAGAACLSILTDTPYFQGRDDDIAAAQCAGLPILRKDFMVDTYQITESRMLGADCILLIMAMLTDEEAHSMNALAQQLGLTVLAESHDLKELERALTLPNALIGINNRNLKTLEINLATSKALAPLIPPDRFMVSESGIRTHQDLVDLAACGADCFLIGEHLLKKPDLRVATREILFGAEYRE